MTEYLPEGSIINTSRNKAVLQSFSALQDSYRSGAILEARATVCTAGHDLLLDLGDIKGVIPRSEGAVGIESGETKDIAVISRVNKPVCFRILGFEHGNSGKTFAICSRSSVQRDCIRDYFSGLVAGDVIPGTVTHLENFGCFVDIGCGISSLLPIDSISISRIAHPSDRFKSGQNIKVVVSGRDPFDRICLSHKELLGTWEENAADFSPGETVAGTIRSVEDYGVFIELSPNLAGLAEPCADFRIGQQTCVYIKSLIPEKMKIKLIVVDAFDGECFSPAPKYYINSGRIDFWRYSPEDCKKEIFTDFASRR